jgi:hypothetical protein
MAGGWVLRPTGATAMMTLRGVIRFFMSFLNGLFSVEAAPSRNGKGG